MIHPKGPVAQPTGGPLQNYINISAIILCNTTHICLLLISAYVHGRDLAALLTITKIFNATARTGAFSPSNSPETGGHDPTGSYSIPSDLCGWT